MTEPAAPSVWAQAMTRLAAAGDRLAATMRARGEAAGNADVYLTFLGALMDTYLHQLSGDPDHPTFVPTAGYLHHTGSPNPDTVYRRARVDGTGTYRLTGEPGTAREVTLMPFDARMRSSRPFDLSDVARGPDGSFDLVMSAEQPATGGTGSGAGPTDWWPIEPEVTSVWLRAVSDRWGEDREPRLAITRVDPSSGRPRLDAAELGKRLAVLAPTVERIVEYGLRHADELAEAGFVNALQQVDYAAQGGLPLQWYHEGLFDLADGDALLVEAEMPVGATYFSWSLTDRMLVTLDWVHAQTSLNRSQASVDPDDVLRVVVSATDPGIRNWMDTTGHRTGVLQCRTAGSSEPPTITCRVVPVRTVDDLLPAGTERRTATERADDLRAREVGSQLRHLW